MNFSKNSKRPLTPPPQPVRPLLNTYSWSWVSNYSVCIPAQKKNSCFVKTYIFSRFFSPFGEIICRPAAVSILMPVTFHIPHLNRYTPSFQGYPQKFGLLLLPNWGDADLCPLKMVVLGVFWTKSIFPAKWLLCLWQFKIFVSGVNFSRIYPSQRQNLLPTLEIITHNFQNF